MVELILEVLKTETRLIVGYMCDIKEGESYVNKEDVVKVFGRFFLMK